MAERKEPAYAIMRVDEFYPAGTAAERLITVTKVMRDAAAAEREVERLNGLKSGKRSRYILQLTRLAEASRG